MSDKDESDLLMRGSLPSIKLSDVGDRFDGVLTQIGEKYQSLTMDGKREPAFWDDEKTQPKWVLPYIFESDADGQEYVLHIGIPSDRQAVFAKAIRDSGETKPRLGGHLSIAVTSKEDIPKMTTKKTRHGAVWTAPATRSGADALMATPAPVNTPAVDLSKPPVAASTPASTPAPATQAAPETPSGGPDLSGVDAGTAALIQQLLAQKK